MLDGAGGGGGRLNQVPTQTTTAATRRTEDRPSQNDTASPSGHQIKLFCGGRSFSWATTHGSSLCALITVGFLPHNKRRRSTVSTLGVWGRLRPLQAPSPPALGSWASASCYRRLHNWDLGATRRRRCRRRDINKAPSRENASHSATKNEAVGRGGAPHMQNRSRNANGRSGALVEHVSSKCTYNIQEFMTTVALEILCKF